MKKINNERSPYKKLSHRVEKWKEIQEPGLKYLADTSNSRQREAIFKDKLIYDLRCAAIQLNYFLEVLRPEVDFGGVDLFLSNRSHNRAVQLKTIVDSFRYTSQTHSWKVPCLFLRPSLEHWDWLNVGNAQDISYANSLGAVTHNGLFGGIILKIIDYNKKDEVTLRYEYTDFTIINSMSRGWFAGKSVATKKSAIILRNKIMNKPFESVKVPRQFFVPVDEPIRLLGSMGFAVPEAPNGLWYYLRNILAKDSMTEDSRFRIQCIFTGDTFKGLDS